MMKKQTVTEARIGDEKALPLVASGFALAADVGAIILLILSGVTETIYLLFPILLVVAGLAYFVTAFFTNFRFRYAIGIAVVYLVAELALTVVMAVLACTAEGTIVTLPAGVFWLATHLICAATVFVCSFSAAKLGGRMRICAVLLAILTAAASAGYIAFSSMNGVFGQGFVMGRRTLVYTYLEEEDAYSVSALAAGRGSVVVIPSEFDGKPVVSVNSEVFLEESVEEVYLDNTQFELVNPEELAEMKGVTVYADKSSFDGLRARYYAEAYEARSEALLNFAGAFAPTGLANGEVYVTFRYTMEAFLRVKGEVLPAWIGQKGEMFDWSFANGVSYALHADDASDADLDWSYRNLGGYILSSPEQSGKAIVNTKISESVQGAEIAFDKIYRLTLDEDNDERYEMPEEYRTTVLGESVLPYRYVTEKTVNGYIDSLPVRSGFTLAFKDGESVIGDFVTCLKNLTGDEITISPVWSLLPPEVTIIDAPSSVLYYEGLNLTVSVVPPAEGNACAYQWGGMASGTGADFTISHFMPTDAGEYTVTVTAGNDAITSLTSTASVSVTISMQKRNLSLFWEELENDVYSASDKAITVYASQDDVVNGDIVTLVPSLTSVRDAGTYTVNAILTGDCAEKYTVEFSAANYIHKYTVLPYELTVSWGDEREFIYDGQEHSPTASITPLAGEDVELILSGRQTNAGEHTAVASIRDTNYTLSGETQAFEILKREITLIWGETEFIYNAYVQSPEVIRVENGVESDNVLGTITVTGGQTNVNASGESYTANATSSNANYTILNSEQNFTISPYTLSVEWGNTNFIYNGSVQTPTASVEPLTGDTVRLAVTGGQTNAGKYTASATGDNANYTLTNAETAYTIQKAPLTVNVQDANKTYDGGAYTNFSVTVTGLVNGETQSVLTVSYTGAGTTAVNAGTYTVSATVAAENYEVTVTAGTLTISPKEISVVWGNTNFTYNGSVQAPTASVTLLTGDIVGLAVTGGQTNANASGESYTANATLSNANYTLTNAATAYTIQKAPLTVNVQDANKTYDGGAYTNFSVTVTGLVNGETQSVLTVSYTDAGTTAVNAGTYTVSATVAADNYEAAVTAGTLTISPKEISVVWGNTNFTYNGSVQTPTASVTLLTGDTVGLAVTGGQKNVNASGESYTANATLSNANYTLLNSEQSFTISPYTLSVEWGNTNFIYNGSVQTPTASVEPLTGDTVCLTVTGEQTNAGEYTASATGDNANYTLTNAETKFTISPKSVALVWSENQDNVTASTASGENLNFSYEYYAEGKKLESPPTQAGSYTVKAVLSDADANNYSLTNDTFTFTISAEQEEEGNGADTNTNENGEAAI